MCVLVSHVRLCHLMDYSPPGSFVHGIFQTCILKWVAISFSRGSSRPRDRTWASWIAGRWFTLWATRKAPKRKKKGINFPCNEIQLLLFFSRPVVSDCLWPHGLQHTRHPCPSPSPRVCPSSCLLHQWYRPPVSSSDALFSFCPQSLPASGTFPMSCLFASDDQNTGASASVSIFPVNIQGWSPLRLIGLIFLLSRDFSGVFSSTTVWRHQFFGVLPSQ